MADIVIKVGNPNYTLTVRRPRYAIGISRGTQGAPGEADKRMGGVLLTDPGAAITSPGNSKAFIRIPIDLNGMSLIAAGASCSAPASAGVTTIQYRRVRAGSADVDMLSTPLTLDTGEIDTITAAVPAVINAANDLVQTGDQIHFDIDSVGTGALGIFVSFTFDTI